MPRTICIESGPSGEDPSLPLWLLLVLTGILAGIQFTWTIELAYGTPYLLSLGLPASLLSMVWLAGPLSGLVMQPIIGILSDASRSSFGRRRPFIAAGSFMVVMAVLLIAYAKELASFMFTEESAWIANTTIAIAVFAFYLLDFSINAVQACARALIIDVAPLHQQNDANAWAGRMIGVGNVLGFAMGYVKLTVLFPWLGDTQLKVLCWMALLLFTLTGTLTCVCVHEQPVLTDLECTSLSSLAESTMKPLKDLWDSMTLLPIEIKRLCYVQLFAWIGWFPLLFYSTAWILTKVQLHTPNVSEEELNETGTRIGSLAMLLFAVISVITGFILPLIAIRAESLPQGYVDQCKQWLTLPKLWALSHWWYAFLMFMTWWVRGIWTAVGLVSLAGVSWGATQWIPFTLLGEYINALNATDSTEEDVQEDYAPLPGQEEDEMNQDRQTSSSTLVDSEPRWSAGVVLGIHNIYIVLPQLISSLLSSIVFYVLTGTKAQGETQVPFVNGTLVHVEHDQVKDNMESITHMDDAFGVVLRIGALSAVVAGWLSLKVREARKRQD